MVMAAAAGLSITLSACTADVPVAEQTPPSAVSTSSSASPTPTVPVAPRLVPDGSAEENLPLFRQVVDGVWAGPDQVSGRAYVDGLVAAGFDKAAMQVTSDTSTVGNPAESIEFSVRWNGQCLIGQVGPAIGAAVTIVAPGLADGGCLLGVTRQIDW